MSTDHKLKDEVLAELAWEPMVNPDRIGVTVRDGLVTLTGYVESYWQKHAAERAVARVMGVRAIAEELVIQLPVTTQRRDDDIAAAIANRLDWDSCLPAGLVSVVVENGVVTLSGTVPHQYQREAALADVQALWGVTGVDNQIVLVPHPEKHANPDRIADDIRRALNRGWFATDTVHVAARGGKVTLSGSAATLRDRNLAVATAWSSPGTVEVENHIRIA